MLAAAVVLSVAATASANTRFHLSSEVPFNEAELRAAVLARAGATLGGDVHVEMDGSQLVLSIGDSHERVTIGARSRAATLRLAAIVIVEQLSNAGATVEPRVRPTVTATRPPPNHSLVLRAELSPAVQRGLGDLDGTTYQGQLAVSVGDQRKGVGVAAGYSYMPLSAFHISQRTLSLGVFASLRRPHVEARVDATVHRFAITGASDAPIAPSIGASALVPIYSGNRVRLFGVAGARVFARRVRLTSPILGSTLHTTPRLEIALGLCMGFEEAL